MQSKEEIFVRRKLYRIKNKASIQKSIQDWKNTHRDRVRELERKYAKKKYHSNPELALKKTKAWRKLNPEKWKMAKNKAHNKHREKIASRPRPFNCEICGELRRIVYDHSHQTGLFRGWICDPCNMALGLVRDNPVILTAMIKYLDINT